MSDEFCVEMEMIKQKQTDTIETYLETLGTIKIATTYRPEAIIMIKIDNIYRTALTDTGATRSIIRPGITTNINTGINVQIELADNTMRMINQEAKVMIQIGSKKIIHNLLIMDGLTTDCIIGLDVMREMDITIRASHNEILIKGESIRFIPRNLAKRFMKECIKGIKTLMNRPFQELIKIGGVTVETTPKQNAWKYAVMEKKLTAEQKDIMEKFLAKRNQYFANQEKPLGQIDMKYAHRVQPAGKPIKRKVKPLSPAMLEEQKKQIVKMLELGVIQPSNSDWAANPSFSPKKDGTWRFNINFRGINKRCEGDSYPIPRAPDLLEIFEGMNWFSKLDASMGYWQLPIHPDDRKYCSFICQEGQFEFCRMSFGLMNAPASYQRMNDDVLKSVLRKFAVVYIDDVIVYSKTFEEHVKQLAIVMDLIYNSGQLLRADKCDFFMREVEYLGHMVGSGGRRMCDNKLRKILALPRPTDKESVRRFLGVTGYYRAYIREYAKIANPLTELTKQDNKFEWTEECEKAYDTIQKLFEANAVLEHPDYSKPFIVECDASDKGVGAVLLQETTKRGIKKDLPVFFASRKLTPGERKWPIRDKEALAIVWALATFRHHILGRHFIVRSDHQSLEWLMEAKTGRLARWALLLSEYEPFTIQYKSGKVNKRADALSRMYEISEILPDIATIAAIRPTSNSSDVMEWRQRFQDATPGKDEIRREQRNDDFCIKRIANIQNYTNFSIQQGILGILVDGKFKPALPRVFNDRIIKAIHHNPLSAHMGVKRTAARVAEIFTMPKLRKEVQKIVSGCLICMSRKQPIQRAGWLASKPSMKMWEQVAMDFAGPYPTSNNQKRYVLVMVDNFSKYVELVPCERMDAYAVINAFYERIICRHGCPERILTDNHRHFKNVALRSVCDVFGIFPAYITPYYPQGNGQAERFMRNLNDSIAMLCDNTTEDWCSYIPGVQFAYNISIHSVTGVTPFFMNHGRIPRMPYETEYTEGASRRITRMKYVKRMRNIIINTHRYARDKCRQAWFQLATAYNRSRKDIKVEIGQWVLMRITPILMDTIEGGRKLPLKWSEPMKVTAVRSSGKAFELEAWDNTKRVVNISRLLPIPPDSWKPDKIAIQRIFDEVAESFTTSEDNYREDVDSWDDDGYYTTEYTTIISKPRRQQTSLTQQVQESNEIIVRQQPAPISPYNSPKSVVHSDWTYDFLDQQMNTCALDDKESRDEDVRAIIEEYEDIQTDSDNELAQETHPVVTVENTHKTRYYTRKQQRLDLECGKDVSNKLLGGLQTRRNTRRT